MNKLLYLSNGDVQSQLATKCNLLVHIGLETLQYIIIDSVRDEIKVLAEYEIGKINSPTDLVKAIEKLPESSKQFKYNFNKVKVSYDTFNYTFIPAELYAQDDESVYAKFIGGSETTEVLVTHVRTADLKNVSAIDVRLHEAIGRIFYKPKIFNQASSFLEGAKKSLSNDTKAHLFLDISSQHFQVAFFNENRFLFYNIFEHANADEFNYYLLNVMNSVSIDPEYTTVVLSGATEANAELGKRVEKYFPTITFADSNKFSPYPEGFEKLLAHTYFSLISLDLCE